MTNLLNVILIFDQVSSEDTAEEQLRDPILSLILLVHES